MIQGYVKKINVKKGTGKRGAWALYSAILEKDDGTESGWVSFGFDKPPFAEGSYISIEAEPGEYGLVYVAGSGKVLDPPAKPPQTAPASVPATVSGTATTPKSTYVDRNDSIVYQSSRKDAIALVGLLLEHDALPMSASTAKAGQAKRFEEISAYVDKITVQYFNDVGSLRLLSTVVDAGAADSGQTADYSKGSDAVDND